MQKTQAKAKHKHRKSKAKRKRLLREFVLLRMPSSQGVVGVHTVLYKKRVFYVSVLPSAIHFGTISVVLCCLESLWPQNLYVSHLVGCVDVVGRCRQEKRHNVKTKPHIHTYV